MARILAGMPAGRVFAGGELALLVVVFILIVIWVYFRRASAQSRRELHGRELWRAMFRRGGWHRSGLAHYENRWRLRQGRERWTRLER